jgi:hypothetical protein
MSIMIEVTSTEVKTRSGTSQRGKAYTINEQAAYMHKGGDPYPEKIKINLENGQPPYMAGNYSLASSSFYVDQFGGIAVRPILVPRPGEERQPSSPPASQQTALPEGVQVKK